MGAIIKGDLMPDIFLCGEKDKESQVLPKHCESFFSIRFFFLVLTLLVVMLLIGGVSI
jgi:hypothetical protein